MFLYFWVPSLRRLVVDPDPTWCRFSRDLLRTKRRTLNCLSSWGRRREKVDGLTGSNSAVD